MSEHINSGAAPELPELSKIDQERLLLMDIQAEHRRQIMADPEGNSSLLDKAVDLAIMQRNFLATLAEAFNLELKEGMESPEDFEPFYNVDNKLATFMMAQGTSQNTEGVEAVVPVIRFEHWVPAERVLNRLKGPEQPSRRAHVPILLPTYEDIAMAQVDENGIVQPRGDFDAEDVEYGYEMLAGLDQAVAFGLLPHADASRSKIMDPLTGEFVRRIEDETMPPLNPYSYDV